MLCFFALKHLSKYDKLRLNIKTASVADRIVDTAKTAEKIDDAVDIARTADAANDAVRTVNTVSDANTVIDALQKTSKGTELLSSVSNQKLKSAIKELYRPGAKIGDGGVADAIRYEIKTGNLVGGKSHIQKGRERLRSLERILEKENLTIQEEDMVKELIEDLMQALGGKR